MGEVNKGRRGRKETAGGWDNELIVVDDERLGLGMGTMGWRYGPWAVNRLVHASLFWAAPRRCTRKKVEAAEGPQRSPSDGGSYAHRDITSAGPGPQTATPNCQRLATGCPKHAGWLAVLGGGHTVLPVLRGPSFADNASALAPPVARTLWDMVALRICRLGTSAQYEAPPVSSSIAGVATQSLFRSFFGEGSAASHHGSRAAGSHGDY